MYRLAVVTILAVLANLPAQADNIPVTVPTEILKAWIPIGFDSNDRVQVLVEPSSFHQTLARMTNP